MKIRLIERDRGRERMKITISSHNEIVWMKAMFSAGREVTSYLHSQSNSLLLGRDLDYWNQLQEDVLGELDRARNYIER